MERKDISRIAHEAADKVNVGKGCECVFPYEKHYIELLFNERIEEEMEKYKELERIISKLPEDKRGIYGGSLSAYKDFTHDLEIVRDRFRAMPSCNPGEYITITDPGKTTFKVGEVVSREAFEKENERVKRLGEAPATKEGSNPGIPYQEEGERIARQLGNGVIYNGPQMYQDKIYAHIFTDVAVTGTTFACLGFTECWARLIQVRKDFGADLPIFEGTK